MIKRKDTKKITFSTEIISIICDICGKEYAGEDIFEIQEFHHIRKTGGYNSVFGDEETIECDICQHCLKKMIDGKYRTIEDTVEEVILHDM